MSDEKGEETLREFVEAPQVDRPGARARSLNNAVAIFAMALVVFIIGVVVGFPLATFGVGFVTENASVVFTLLFAFFVLAVIVAGTVLIFRRPIWESLFRRGEVEMERFARPLANVARFAALKQVAEATESARDLAELVLARYAWISTRRWLMATVTAFIAAIAALAGSALLFQQNQLLRNQIDLMQEQNQRIAEQNRMIEAQIELGEAQRSTSIVPEILEIGALVGSEVQALGAAGNADPSINDLSAPLRARIAAASNAARPYRYLRTPLTDLDDGLLMKSGLLRRADLPASQLARDEIAALGGTAPVFEGEQRGVMSDRPVSPERGQLLTLLAAMDIHDIGALPFADFSFAEIRTSSMSALQLQSSMLRFADFDRQMIIASSFDGANLEHARFRNARLSHNSFASTLVPELNYTKPAELAGTDFSGAILTQISFEGSRGFGQNFDRAVLHNVQFTNTDLSAGTFRNSIFGVVDFTGATLKSVDFDGAIVFAADFIETVAAQAAPETFTASRFALEPLAAEEFERHPRWADAWLDGLQDGQAYRVMRVEGFE
jgi:hypothetical protein